MGYNATFVATEPMRLALVAAGYGDGLDRRLSNRFILLVRGQRAPIVGRISMDQTVLDVTEIEGVETGDEVVLSGRQGAERSPPSIMPTCGDHSVGDFYADQCPRGEARNALDCSSNVRLQRAPRGPNVGLQVYKKREMFACSYTFF